MHRDPTDGNFQPDIVMSLRLLLNFHRQGSPLGGTPSEGNDETAVSDEPGAGVRDYRHQAQSLEALVGICITALDTVASPLCAVCSDGRLLFANRAARCSLRQGQWLESYGGRISTPARHCVAPAFDLAMARLRTGTGSTLLLTDRRDGQRAVVSVAPVCVDQYQERTLPENLGLVWLTTNESAQTPVQHMAQLFNLTPAEQNLLSSLTGGIGLRDAASHLKVSIHTVRNQLKSVLNKTGRHSQAQLMTLVTRMASLRLPDPV
jgi:DNA-binding CsgD family transcriptional regulator